VPLLAGRLTKKLGIPNTLVGHVLDTLFKDYSLMSTAGNLLGPRSRLSNSEKPD